MELAIAQKLAEGLARVRLTSEPSTFTVKKKSRGVSIDIDNFPSLSAVLMELEKHEKLESFTAIDAKTNQERKPTKTFTAKEAELKYQLDSPVSQRQANLHKFDVQQPRLGLANAPNPFTVNREDSSVSVNMENFPSLTAALIGLERFENLELSIKTAATEAAGPAKHLSKQLGERAGGRKGIGRKLGLEP